MLVFFRRFPLICKQITTLKKIRRNIQQIKIHILMGLSSDFYWYLHSIETVFNCCRSIFSLHRMMKRGLDHPEGPRNLLEARYSLLGRWIMFGIRWNIHVEQSKWCWNCSSTNRIYAADNGDEQNVVDSTPLPRNRYPFYSNSYYCFMFIIFLHSETKWTLSA